MALFDAVARLDGPDQRAIFDAVGPRLAAALAAVAARTPWPGRLALLRATALGR